MLNKNNPIIKRLSSVDFALFIISTIALTSIAGTIIQQGESLQFYAERYGSKPALILELLDLTDMYSSYWFQGLLILFCLNLIICTWVRLPGVMATLRKDNLEVSKEIIAKAKDAIILKSDQPCDPSKPTAISDTLAPFSLKRREGIGQEWLFLYENGKWSRAGAYIVHASILLIICGALVGKYFGYDAFVMVPEGTAESSVRKYGEWHKDIPLDFEVFCRNFKTDYYPNGTPKAYRSDLTVFEDGKKVLDKTITVNDPLKYRGITFFQSSYKAIDNEYKLTVSKEGASTSDKRISKTFYLNPFSEHKSDDLGLSFKILATAPDGHGHGPYKLQITDATSSLNRVMNDYEMISIQRGGAVYNISLAQRHATGLKVVKDPGVWIVYIGCALMMVGLYISFFMSHIRIWILYQPDKSGSVISVVGKTNKNTMKLEHVQEKIVAALLQKELLGLRRV
jgi:cytochrome c biogenesis protein